jgi:hypothetical protein
MLSTPKIAAVLAFTLVVALASANEVTPLDQSVESGHLHALPPSMPCPAARTSPNVAPPTQAWISKNIGPSYSWDSTKNMLCGGVGGACNPLICPVGMQWDGTACVAPACNCPASKPLCIRGMCFAAEPTAAEIVNTLPRPKIALYHGGVVGEAANDAAVFKTYLADTLRFVQDRNIDIVYIKLGMWHPSKNQFMYLQDPAFLAENFLIPLGNLAKSQSRTIQAGVVAYLRPKDAGWNIDRTLPGGYMRCSVTGPGSPCTNGPMVTPAVACPINTLSSCQPSCPACPDCSSSCASKCKGTCFPKCPTGCYNIAAQVMKYVGEVNKAAASKTSSLISYFSYDGEDAGGMGALWSDLQIRDAAKMYAPDVTHFGYAKAVSAGPQIYKSATPNAYSMAETYWYGPDAYPASGSQWQLTNKPAVITTETSYTVFKNKPQAWVDYYMGMAHCLNNNFDSYVSSTKTYPLDVVPMFSLENLSLPTDAPSCIALNYYGPTGTPKTDVCGTLDAFSSWGWTEMDAMMRVWASKMASVTGQQVTDMTVGLYESQFIPAHWFKNGKFATTQYAHKPPSQSCSDLVIKCDHTGDPTFCTDALAKYPKLCNVPGYTVSTYCGQNGYCKIHESKN